MRGLNIDVPTADGQPRGMSAAGYGRGQRLLEYAAISVFALLACFAFARLAAAAGWHLPLAVLVAVPVAWLAADLFSGVVHWLFDAFGSVRTPVIGNALIRPFRAHHADPEEMTRHDFVETHGASCFAALLLLVGANLVPVGTWAWMLAQALLLFTALGALATNQCHKWAHMEEAATPGLVRWAQRLGLVVSREVHRLHHTAPFDSYYCMANGWLNAPFNAILRRAR